MDSNSFLEDVFLQSPRLFRDRALYLSLFASFKSLHDNFHDYVSISSSKKWHMDLKAHTLNVLGISLLHL
jgi:hypothetical protein